jgi:serine protease inhibitor
MPKFKISKKVDVSDILQDMGVNKVFEGAELSQMTDAGQLTVSSVLHKAVIEVDKKGTTAAASTGIELVLLSASFGERIRLEVNHPFIFIIQDTKNKIPVMVGRVMDPRQTV